MGDDLLNELVEWWQDVAGEDVGSRIVLLPVPRGWGRTALLDRLWIAIREDSDPPIVRISGDGAPPERAQQPLWLDGHGPSGSTIRRVAETTAFDGVQGVILAVGAAGLGVPALGGEFGLVLTTAMGMSAAAVRNLFPNPVEQARRAGRHLAARSDWPVVVLVDDPEQLDPRVAEGFLVGLVEHVERNVLVVVTCDPNSDLHQRLHHADRVGALSDRVHAISIADAKMTIDDRRLLIRLEAPQWSIGAVERLAQRTATFDEVRSVLDLPGAAEIPACGTDAVVGAVDALIDPALPRGRASAGALIVAWAGGVMTVEQMSSGAGVLGARADMDAGDVIVLDSTIRLAPGVPLDFLRSTAEARFARNDRREAARAVLACPLPFDLTPRIAALRVILSFAERAELETDEALVTACSELAVLLEALGDRVEARLVAETLCDLSKSAGLDDAVVETLVQLRLRIGTATSAPSHLLEALLLGGEQGTHGLETRTWAAIAGLAHDETRAEALLLADELASTLDPAVVGDIAYRLRLALGQILDRQGYTERAATILKPVAALPDGDDRRAGFDDGPPGDGAFIAALEHALTLLDPSAIDTRMALQDALATEHSRNGAYRRALMLGKSLLTDRICVFGMDHPNTLLVRASVARWTGLAGDAREAVRLFTDVVLVVERVLGVDHPQLLASRSNLATWVGFAGQPHKALQMFVDLLPELTRVVGADHRMTLGARFNLGSWAGLAGDRQQAVRVLADLLPDQIRALGADDAQSLATRENLAVSMAETGDREHALRLLIELLPDQARALGPDHPTTLTTRSNIASWTGASDPQEALRLSVELYPVQVRVLGGDHPNTLATRAEIAAWTGAGDPREALRLFVELLPDLARVLGADHPETLKARANIASWSERAGDRQEALRILLELLPDRVRILSSDHPDTLTTQRAIERLGEDGATTE